jgi:hypothetical protein
MHAHPEHTTDFLGARFEQNRFAPVLGIGARLDLTLGGIAAFVLAYSVDTAVINAFYQGGSDPLHEHGTISLASVEAGAESFRGQIER